MAIVVEEGKPKSGLMYIIGGAIAAIVLIWFTWWLFFTTPPRVDVLAPTELEPISRITEVKTDPGEILNSPTFQLLEERVGPIEIGEFGRENPFARF